MARVPITLAVGDYDHTRDLVSGRVPVEGVELNALNLPIEEIFYRFTFYREWDVSEMSMGKYASLRSQEDTSLTAIPVFPSRMFRHSMIYVRSGGGIRRPGELAGKRVGVPEWAQTACIYSRGYLAHTVGVALTAIDWVQAGVNEAGRIEKVKLRLPEGLKLRRVPDRSLTELLLAGEIDAILSARPPRALGQGIERLFPDYRREEENYYRDTGIHPIMHVIALRTELLERHPWLAMNLLQAFEEAKRRCYVRLSDITASHAPFAWLKDYADRMRALFGEDFFPYGLEANRTTIEAYLEFAHEQGVCHRRLSAEELFPKSVLSTHKV